MIRHKNYHVLFLAILLSSFCRKQYEQCPRFTENIDFPCFKGMTETILFGIKAETTAHNDHASGVFRVILIFSEKFPHFTAVDKSRKLCFSGNLHNLRGLFHGKCHTRTYSTYSNKCHQGFREF